MWAGRVNRPKTFCQKGFALLPAMAEVPAEATTKSRTFASAFRAGGLIVPSSAWHALPARSGGRGITYPWSRTSPLATMRIAHPYPAGFQGSADGVGVSVELVSDAGQRPAVGVKSLREDDVVGGESLAAQGSAVAVEVGRDGGAVDTEPLGEGVDALPVLVGRDQVGDLLGRKFDRCGAGCTDDTCLVTGGHFWQVR